jgi:putative molybdopterin biosynthesis protein
VNAVQQIDSFHDLKILSDPRRLAILRLLMKLPATLSQLGEALDMTAARVRHHLKILEDTGMVELVRTQPVRGFVEKYYRATSQAYFINAAVMPEPSKQGTIYLIGSHDPALELLAEYLEKDERTPNLVAIPVGSLEGLIALRQGFCQMTGCHLFDPVNSEYNTPYVRHFFPGQTMHIVTLAHRQQGLLVAPGNPHHIQGLEDLGRDDLTFINRKPGSGTRLWLDQQLRTLGVEASQIRGYTREVSTHSQVAEAVHSGKADVGLAVLAVAQKINLAFIPLFEERFDLVIPDQGFRDPLLAPLFESLLTAFVRNWITSLMGYRSTETGKEIHIT